MPERSCSRATCTRRLATWRPAQGLPWLRHPPAALEGACQPARRRSGASRVSLDSETDALAVRRRLAPRLRSRSLERVLTFGGSVGPGLRRGAFACPGAPVALVCGGRVRLGN